MVIGVIHLMNLCFSRDAKLVVIKVEKDYKLIITITKKISGCRNFSLLKIIIIKSSLYKDMIKNQNNK